MRKILSTMVTIACLAFFAQAGVANDSANTKGEKTNSFSVSGTYRFRGEVHDGFNIRAYGTGTREDYLLSRVRLDIN